MLKWNMLKKKNMHFILEYIADKIVTTVQMGFGGFGQNRKAFFF